MIDKHMAPFGALLLRVSLGVMFLAHSLYLKLVVFTLPGTVKFFESLGLPGFATHLTIAVEAIGGTPGLLEGNPGQIMPQIYGILATVVWCGVVSWIILKMIGRTRLPNGIRSRTSAYRFRCSSTRHVFFSRANSRTNKNECQGAPPPPCL